MGFKIQNLQPHGTVRFVLTGVRTPGAPRDAALILKHAGKGNPGWESARRKIDANAKARAGAAEAEEILPLLIEPFAKHVVEGWEDVNDENGKPETITSAKCEEFLRYVIEMGGSDIVDQAIGYSLSRANFRDYVAPAVTEALGKG